MALNVAQPNILSIINLEINPFKEIYLITLANLNKPNVNTAHIVYTGSAAVMAGCYKGLLLTSVFYQDFIKLKSTATA
jgi:hypothetical protein